MFQLRQELRCLRLRKQTLDPRLLRVFDWSMNEVLAQPKQPRVLAGLLRNRGMQALASSDLGPRDSGEGGDRSMTWFFLLMAAVLVFSIGGIALVAAGYTVALPAFLTGETIMYALGATIVILAGLLTGLGFE